MLQEDIDNGFINMEGKDDHNKTIKILPYMTSSHYKLFL